MANEKKYEIVNLGKAIGIILMVIGHTQCPTFLLKLIYSFHMPLFFFLSGYCFKEKYLSEPRQFVLARVKGLYIPFVKYCLLFLLIHNICYDLHFYSQGVGGGYYSPTIILKKICSIIFFMTCEDSLLGGFWFLRALLWGALISYVMIRIFKDKYWIGILCLFLGALIMKLFHIVIPLFCISDWMMIAALFHYAGWTFAHYEARGSFLMTRSRIIVLALFFFILHLLLVYIYPTDIFAVENIGMIPCLLMSLSGIIVTFIISSFISFKKYYLRGVVNYIGHNTLIILAWHFITFKIVSLAIVFIYNYPIDYLGYFPFIPGMGEWWIVYAVAGVIVPVLVLYIERNINDYIKFKLK